MYKFAKFLANIYISIFYRCKVSGKENIPDEGPVVICYNHLSALDPLFVACKIKRPIVFVAKKELWNIKPLKPILNSCRVIPVNRGNADLALFKAVLKRLKQGEVVAISPYGTRVLHKNIDDVEVKGGAAMMAVMSGATVIPLAFDTEYKLFRKVKMTFGKPRIYSDDERNSSSGAQRKIAVDIMKEIEDMVVASRGEK